MRTTVTLDEDVVAKLNSSMRERGISFKQALNTALRAGLAGGTAPASPYRQGTFCAEIQPGINIVKALQLGADLDDEETARQIELGR